jgi:hypothetical protein
VQDRRVRALDPHVDGAQVVGLDRPRREGREAHAIAARLDRGVVRSGCLDPPPEQPAATTRTTERERPDAPLSGSCEHPASKVCWTLRGGKKGMRREIVLAVVVAGAGAVAGGAGSPAQGTLIVTNKGDRTLGIIDPAEGKQVAALEQSGVTGHELIASPDGRTAYVPIYGDSGRGRPGSDGQTIDVFDLVVATPHGDDRPRPAAAAARSQVRS